MAFSKVILNGQTLMDITQDTVTAAAMKKDITAHKNDGTQITGTIEDPDPNGNVIFIDYDGTLVASKTTAQISAMTSDTDLPANPTHTGLTAQGWNWTVAQLKAQLTAMPTQKVYVGQMYTTASGATEIDVVMKKGRLSPILTICVNGTVSVDWGDNTTPDSVTGTSLTTKNSVPHTYAIAGSYTIKISRISGDGYSFYCSTSDTILKRDTPSTGRNRVYTNCIHHIRIGNYAQIGQYAFYYCTSLASITIPNTVTTLGQDAFHYCYSLASVTIPNSETTIYSSEFTYCNSLSRISIPNNVTKIGGSAFSYCNNIFELTIPSNVTLIESAAFSYCYSLSSVNMPNNITVLYSSAFSYCSSLSDINIPNNLTGFQSSVFANCYSLIKATIPSGVTMINNNAFQNCQGMAEYHVLPSAPPTLGSTVFNSIQSDCVIYVPNGKLATYQGATGWSDYASYMQEEPAS